MFGTFILGVIAGFGAPYAEPKIMAAMNGVLLDSTSATPREAALLSFATCLLGAAILSMILFVPHAAPLALGAIVGVFGPKLVDKWKASKTPDYDS